MSRVSQLVAGRKSKLGLRALALPILLGLLGMPLAARAEINAEASISATQVGTGEPFTLTVQVVSEEKNDNLPWPEVGNLDKFTVSKATGTSRNSQTSIINGRVSSKNLFITNFTYTLTAQKPGTYQVGPIKYAYKNFEKALGSANVTVSKQEAGLTTQPSVSKKSVYLGEQVLYNLRITAAPEVQQINPSQDLQKLIGEKFWLQRLDKTIEAKVSKINEKSYHVFDIRIGLFPLIAGKVELPGIPVEYQQVSRAQRRRPGSVFEMFDDDFFGNGSVVNLTTVSNPMSLEVLPLPSGAPADFGGSVGQYTLSAATDKTSLASGDALTMTVTIRGDGEPKSINKPTLPDLGQFEAFDPEITTNTVVQGASLVTTKTFKYVLVPHRKGDYTIGPVAFNYFDPAKREYIEAKSQPIAITVTPGKEVAASPGRVLSQREITDIGSDIRHIKVEAAPLENEDDFLYKRGWFWLLFAPSPTAFALLMFVRIKKQRLESDATLKRKTFAGAQLRKRLKEANEALKQKNSREFYKALSQAVVGFASDKTNVEFRGLTMDEAKGKLAGNGLSAATVEEYEKLIQQCDFGQFAGAERDEKAWKNALDLAEALLRKLDREL